MTLFIEVFRNINIKNGGQVVRYSERKIFYRQFPFISDLDCYSVFRKENMFL
jgi:hypothetical protein